LFGAKGFEKTTLKQIAEAADVSPALVIHHYGSKQQLRRACDEYVIAKLIDERFTSASAPSADLVQTLLAEVNNAGPQLQYIARMLIESGSAGDELFRRLVASTKENLAQGREAGSIQSASDPDVSALLLTVFGLAQFLLRDRMTEALGVDPFSVEGASKLTIPTLELLTEGLYASAELLEAAREALASQE
jgi:AcrR family transcriptional regulator